MGLRMGLGVDFCLGFSSEGLLLEFELLSFGDFSCSCSLQGMELSLTDFECFEDLELLGSGCFEPCFDFFFCSEATFAEAGGFVDGANGDARGDDACLSADGCFGGGVGRCHGI